MKGERKRQQENKDRRANVSKERQQAKCGKNESKKVGMILKEREKERNMNKSKKARKNDLKSVKEERRKRVKEKEEERVIAILNR